MTIRCWSTCSWSALNPTICSRAGGAKQAGIASEVGNTTNKMNKLAAKCFGSSKPVVQKQPASSNQMPDPPHVLGRSETMVSISETGKTEAQTARAAQDEPRSPSSQASALSSSDLCCPMALPPLGSLISQCLEGIEPSLALPVTGSWMMWPRKAHVCKEGAGPEPQALSRSVAECGQRQG